jgi:hypothetical protein
MAMTQLTRVSSLGFFAMLFCAVSARGSTTIVLDPGDGRQYLANWCGGQGVNEYAGGFDSANNAQTAVIVSARCSTGGRGSSPRTYVKCWVVAFDLSGVILSKQPYGGYTVYRGVVTGSCSLPFTVDAAQSFTLYDDNAQPIVTLATAQFAAQYAAYGPVYRAYLQSN